MASVASVTLLDSAGRGFPCTTCRSDTECGATVRIRKQQLGDTGVRCVLWRCPSFRFILSGTLGHACAWLWNGREHASACGAAPPVVGGVEKHLLGFEEGAAQQRAMMALTPSSPQRASSLASFLPWRRASWLPCQPASWQASSWSWPSSARPAQAKHRCRSAGKR